MCTQPLFVAALSGILLHEPIKREAIPGAIVAIIGAALIALLSIGIGATILAGMVTIYYDVPRQMRAQMRSYGANMLLMPGDGETLDSEKLAQKLKTLFVEGKSDIIFVIGGSLGLDEAVTRRAQEHMSMSAMTFPHQLARVMLMEQLYRAESIQAGSKYHK